MIRPPYRTLLSICLVLTLAGFALAYPKPGPTPHTWQFVFDHSRPKRLVIRPPGSEKPEAYWYMTYTISNPSRQAQAFNPIFELVTDDGLVIRSDGKRYETVDGQVREVMRTITVNGQKQQVADMIPQVVLDTIRIREKNPSLKSVNQIAGTLRSGTDEAKEGVAIWPEPSPRMGQFAIYATGLSGDIVTLKQAGNDFVEIPKDEVPAKTDKLLILRRTLQMKYQQLGDEKNPGDDRLDGVGEEWVYR